MPSKLRCTWCNNSALEQQYHDREWGVPLYDDRLLFEMLNLEGAQAGLSWVTILKKREGYRAAFHGFAIEAVSQMTADDVERLVLDPNIVRHRQKIAAVLQNARSTLALYDSGTTLSDFLWQFVGGTCINNAVTDPSAIQASSKESATMSKELRRKGFAFVGPTTCYAFMQAVGMVNDHLVQCYRYAELSEGR